MMPFLIPYTEYSQMERSSLRFILVKIKLCFSLIICYVYSNIHIIIIFQHQMDWNFILNVVNHSQCKYQPIPTQLYLKSITTHCKIGISVELQIITNPIKIQLFMIQKISLSNISQIQPTTKHIYTSIVNTDENLTI